MGLDPQHRRFLSDLREVVLSLREAQTVPPTPTNLTVTPEAFSNLVQWTRSTGADYSEVLWNTSPTLPGAIVVPVGNAQQWTDNVGQAGVKRWYWVRARKSNGAQSLETPPVAGTTLASGTAVPPPKTPPIGQQQRIDQRTGQRYPY